MVLVPTTLQKTSGYRNGWMDDWMNDNNDTMFTTDVVPQIYESLF